VKTLEEPIQATRSEGNVSAARPDTTAGRTMKALVYHGPGRRAWEDKPRPALRESTDAIVRLRTSTICGTDLHILKGDVPTVEEGRILGHEGVGSVEELGSAVRGLRKGDLVLISCITSCGTCDYCKRGMYSHCRTGGWILGHTIDGTQAEYVRIPHAATSLYPLAPDSDENAFTMLSDIFPTAFECGVQNGQVKPGDTVAIVGAGPIGLAALLTAQLYSPAEIVVVDVDRHRLAKARELGATRVVDASDGRATEWVLELTGGAGADVVIEAVGTPAAFDICQAVVAPGGRIANVGVHGKPVQLALQKLWYHNITLTTRLVDTVTTPMLLRMVQARKLRPAGLVTHSFDLGEVMKAYDVFANASQKHALKVVLKSR
jgi:alcohol dehydrogenase